MTDLSDEDECAVQLMVGRIVGKGRNLPCPFCGATPVTRALKARTCQLHGDPIQDWMAFCPHGHAQTKAPTKELALRIWNQRTDNED